MRHIHSNGRTDNKKDKFIDKTSITWLTVTGLPEMSKYYLKMVLNILELCMYIYDKRTT